MLKNQNQNILVAHAQIFLNKAGNIAPQTLTSNKRNCYVNPDRLAERGVKSGGQDFKMYYFDSIMLGV